MILEMHSVLRLNKSHIFYKRQTSNIYSCMSICLYADGILLHTFLNPYSTNYGQKYIHVHVNHLNILMYYNLTITILQNVESKVPQKNIQYVFL